MGEPVQSAREVFERHMPERLRSRPDVVAKINAVYRFDISGPGGGTWGVDCTAPGGAVSAGAPAAPRCTVAMSDGDLVSLVNGRLNAQMAFMTGKLKIQGDMGLAMKLQSLLT